MNDIRQARHLAVTFREVNTDSIHWVFSWLNIVKQDDTMENRQQNMFLVIYLYVYVIN